MNNAEYFKAWMLILMRVNYTDKNVLIGNSVIECKRGESLNSYDTWAKIFGVKNWNVSKVRRFFDLLEKDSMIVRKRVPNTTHLRVVNYSTYQDEQQADDTQMTGKRQADDTQMTPTKERKKEKKGKNLKEKEVPPDVLEIFNYFKSKLKPGSRLDIETKGTKASIQRAIDNYTIPEIKAIIDLKAKECIGHQDKQRYYTTTTVFRAKNMMNYHNEIINVTKPSNGQAPKNNEAHKINDPDNMKQFQDHIKREEEKRNRLHNETGF
ncbi:MAG: hypothetical protein GY853_14475 [PVC group bacterium]|nr:hypothetical protein [PVC group bacterium]